MPKTEAQKLANREYMRRKRADPIQREKIKAIQRKSYANGGAKRQKEFHRKRKEEHFFIWRAKLWSYRFKVSVTPEQLFFLWKQQRGRCDISGRKLFRDAQLDHIVPQKRGGIHTIENLRWLDPHVNHAKNDLTEEEFYKICKDVVYNGY